MGSDQLAPLTRTPARELQPVPKAGAFAATPLGLRLATAVAPVVGSEQAEGTAEILGRGLASLLGADLSAALAGLQLKDLVRGELTLVLDLRDARHYQIERPDGPPLKVRVPRSAQGTAARLQLTLVTDDDGTPRLQALDLGFGSQQAPADRASLRPGELPRLQNPSALEPTGNPLKDGATDLAAAIALRGLHVDAAGQIHLDADVSVLNGLFTQDFGALARDRLPTLNTDLRALAQGQAIAGAEASTADTAGTGAPGLSSLLHGFTSAATGGRWELRLELAGAEAPLLSSSGALTAHSPSDLALEGGLELGVGGERVQLALRADNTTADGVRGQARVEVARGEGPARGVGLRWDADGAQPGGVDLRALFPTQLAPWRGDGEAPRVGSAAFKQRLAALLDEAAPLTSGNQLRFVRDGDQVLAERLRLIEGAAPGQTVLLQTFILHDDVTGAQIVDALIAARARGVEVKVLVDSFGSGEQSEDFNQGNAACRRLREGGVDVQLHNPPGELLRPLLALARDALPAQPLSPALRAAFPATARAADALQDLARTGQLAVQPLLLVPLALALGDAAQELWAQRARPLPAELAALARGLRPLAEGALAQLGADPAAILRQLLPELGREHRKLLAVYGPGADGAPRAEMMVGGNNVDDLYQLEPGSPGFDPARHGGAHLWNDADLVVTGRDAVAAAVAGFRDTFPGTPPAEVPAAPSPRADRGAALRVVHHVPEAAAPGQGDSHFDATLLAVLEGLGGGDRLAIETPFFVPLPEIQQALLAAAERGARIDIVTNGVTENNTMGLNESVARHTRQFVLPALVAHPRIGVHETLGSAQPVHRKTLVVRTAADQHLFMVGSQNLDRLSAGLNRELFVIGGSAASDAGAASKNDLVARELWLDLERDTRPGSSRQVTAEELKLEPEQVIAGYARSLISPLF